MQHEDMNMKYRHAAKVYSMDMINGHVASICSVDMQRGHAAWKQHGNAAFTCSMDVDMQHGHGHVARTCTYSVDIQHRHVASSCDMDMQLGQAAWHYSIYMHHGHEHGCTA
jgi:hypothetical protein